MTKQDLINAVDASKILLFAAENALEDFNSLAENNVFDDLENANYKIEGILEDKASNACEGSHCRGLSKYTQEFIVDGITYIGTLYVEYNRHDKTYYYVDSSEYSFCAK